jgi:ribonuclease BN (tRNA processing enzyme)
MIKNVKVIGAGGAFDFGYTNSSFLISTSKNKILFDCGYNVFEKLKRDEEDILKDINCIILSHDDDDHIGSVKSLLFYKYFIHNQKNIKVFAPAEMRSFFEKMNFVYDNYQLVPAEIVEFYDIEDINNHFDESFISIEGLHHTKSYGILINDGTSSLLISGDTKANAKFEEELRKFNPNDLTKNVLIFHDYSFWDEPSKQTHACETDYNETYSENFRERVFKYHNQKAAKELEGVIFVAIDLEWV